MPRAAKIFFFLAVAIVAISSVVKFLYERPVVLEIASQRIQVGDGLYVSSWDMPLGSHEEYEYVVSRVADESLKKRSRFIVSRKFSSDFRENVRPTPCARYPAVNKELGATGNCRIYDMRRLIRGEVDVVVDFDGESCARRFEYWGPLEQLNDFSDLVVASVRACAGANGAQPAL
jgi:hypothetical protein